jgi:WD40 repeat protein
MSPSGRSKVKLKAFCLSLVVLLSSTVLGQTPARPRGPGVLPLVVLSPLSHSGPVNAINMDSTLGVIVTGSDDGTIRVWNAPTGDLIGLPHSDYTHRVLSVVARPSSKGELAASFSTAYSSDSYVGLLDVATGAIRKLCSERATQLSFSPDGKTLVVLGSGHLSWWDVGTGKRLQRIDSPGSRTDFLDNSILAVQLQNTVALVNLATGDPELQVQTGPGTTFVIDRNADLLFHLYKKTVSIWSIHKATRLNTIELLSEAQFLAYDADHRYLFAAGFQSGGIGGASQNRLYRISGPTWDNLEGVDGPDNQITALSVIGGQLMVGERDGKVLRYDLRHDLEVRPNLGIRTDDISSLAMSLDNRFLAAGDGRGLVHIWELDSSTYRQLDRFNVAETHDPYFPADSRSRGVRETFVVGQPAKPAFVAVLRMAFVGDSTKLAIYYGNGDVIVEDILSQQVFLDEKISGADLTDFLTIGNGTLAIGSVGKVHIWNLDNRQSSQVDVHLGNLRSIGRTPDSKNIIAVGSDGIELISLSNPSGDSLQFRLKFPGECKVLGINDESIAVVSETSLITWKFKSSSSATSALDRGITSKLIPDMNAVPASYVLPDKLSMVTSGAYGIHTWNWKNPNSLHHIEPGFSVTALSETPDGKTIIAGGRNGRIQLIDLSSGDNLGIIYVVGPAGWYVYTPKGLIDGLPALWDRLKFALITKQLAVINSQQVFGELYTPGLISKLLARSIITRSAAAPNSVLTTLESIPSRISPPRVDITAPLPTVTVGHGKLQTSEWDLLATNGTTVRKIPSVKPQPEGSLVESGPRLTEGKVSASLRVTDGGGSVSSCKLFRNRQLVHSFESPPVRNGTVDLTATVEMLAGNIEFSAYCFDRYGIRSAIARTTVVGDPKLKRGGKVYILAVGVNTYPRFGGELHFAKADADLVSSVLYDELSKSGEFKAVIPPVELPDDEATAENVLTALNRLAGKYASHAIAPPQVSALSATTPEDAVFVYFAGHGGKMGSRYLLLTSDFKMDDSSKRWTGAITDIDLATTLGSIGAGKIVLIIDACEAGYALGRERASVGPFNFKSFAQMAYDKGIFVIAATQSNESAHEVPELGHGLFTFILAEDGLRLHLADWRPPDGKITVKEWLQYAAEHQRPVSRHFSAPSESEAARPFSENGASTVHATSLWEQTPRLFLPDVYYGFDFPISYPGRK